MSAVGQSEFSHRERAGNWDSARVQHNRRLDPGLIWTSRRPGESDWGESFQHTGNSQHLSASPPHTSSSNLKVAPPFTWAHSSRGHRLNSPRIFSSSLCRFSSCVFSARLCALRRARPGLLSVPHWVWLAAASQSSSWLHTAVFQGGPPLEVWHIPLQLP